MKKKNKTTTTKIFSSFLRAVWDCATSTLRYIPCQSRAPITLMPRWEEVRDLQVGEVMWRSLTGPRVCSGMKERGQMKSLTVYLHDVLSVDGSPVGFWLLVFFHSQFWWVMSCRSSVLKLRHWDSIIATAAIFWWFRLIKLTWVRWPNILCNTMHSVIFM